jgi:pyruvate,water dikinase
MKPLILSLNEIKTKEHEAIVGVKAFHLAQLLHQGLSIPQAFVVTTHAFDLFFEKNNLFYLLERLSTEDNRRILAEICQELRRKIKKGVMPSLLEKEIEKEIDKKRLPFIAVRSSATAEDLAGASFAGQFESYLNIPRARLFDYIKTCWASLCEDRVLPYTLYHKIPMHRIKMAVLVQEMIKAEKGGVIFTKDILRDNERVMVIEAVNGLGEKVVSGTSEPDRYLVEKHDLKTISQKLKGKKAVLSQEEIFSLTSLGLLVENFYHSSQDIEWLIKNGKVFLLQARPITT